MNRVCNFKNLRVLKNLQKIHWNVTKSGNVLKAHSFIFVQKTLKIIEYLENIHMFYMMFVWIYSNFISSNKQL